MKYFLLKNCEELLKYFLLKNCEELLKYFLLKNCEEILKYFLLKNCEELLKCKSLVTDIDFVRIVQLNKSLTNHFLIIAVL